MLFTNLPQLLEGFYTTGKNKMWYFFSSANKQKMLTVKHVQIYNIKNGTKYNNGSNAHNNHMVDALELYIQENSHLINPRQMKLNMLSYNTSSRYFDQFSI